MNILIGYFLNKGELIMILTVSPFKPYSPSSSRQICFGSTEQEIAAAKVEHATRVLLGDLVKIAGDEQKPEIVGVLQDFLAKIPFDVNVVTLRNQMRETLAHLYISKPAGLDLTL